MSCCSGCQSNWFTGLAGLGSLTLPPNQAGAAFQLGVELDGFDVLGRGISETLERIRIAVQQGGFVQIPVQVYSMAGFTDFNPFIVVQGNARYAHSSATHLQNAILSSVGSVVDYDAGSVRFEIDTYDPATGQPNTDPSKRRYDAPAGAGASPPPDVPKPVEWPEFIRRLAAELEVDPATAFAILLGGGLVGVVALKKLL